MNTTLQIRINKNTKQKAQKVFKKMGIDMSSGVKMYLSHVVNTGSLPFTPRTKNGFTPAQEKEIIRETKEALTRGKSYDTADDLFKNLLK